MKPQSSDSRFVCEPLENRRLLSAFVQLSTGGLFVRQGTAVPIQNPGEPSVTINLAVSQPYSGDVGVVDGLTNRRHLRATIDWGDGRHVRQAFVRSDLAGSVHIASSHVYTQPGTFPITVTLTRSGRGGGLVTQFTSTANVVQESATIRPIAGQEFTGAVATLPQGPFSAGAPALIDWGDGQSSQGTLESDSQGGLDVIGTHTYARPGIYRVSVAASPQNATSNVVTSVTSTAMVGEPAETFPGAAFFGI